MTLATLGNRDARRIFLHRHLLGDAPQGPAGGDALLQLIRGLGFVQLDSINTVARAHDLILFSRRQRYRPQALKNLYERDGALFEHWTHDAAGSVMFAITLALIVWASRQIRRPSCAA